jgi:hypothetical protein
MESERGESFCEEWALGTAQIERLRAHNSFPLNKRTDRNRFIMSGFVKKKLVSIPMEQMMPAIVQPSVTRLKNYL